ncbi:MAG: ATP-binding protein [Candidatus Eisenbacteria bacterium]|nr:ATP-binding protein [Candidatus Eisenbacteria bacterium]
MFQRALAPKIRALATSMPIVTLTGPRQSGKTTLVRSEFPDLDYVSLEPADVRREAREDPRGLLARHERGAIFDEIQRAPELLSYLQVMVDENPRPGRFVLTGSQSLLLMEHVSQSLAGRTAVLELLPLTIAELEGARPLDFERLCTGDAVAPPPARPVWEILWTGFYPRIHDQRLDPTDWLESYLRSYIERDLRDQLRVMNLATFERFVRLAASRTGQELNLLSLAEDVGISQPTARQWMNVLETGFIVTLLQQHHQNFGKRVRRRPKLIWNDTGLVCCLLGIRSPAILATHPLRGAIFETFVAGELRKAYTNRGREAPLYYWRDASGHEVDLVVDLGDRLIGIEVKSGETFNPSMLDGLRWWHALSGNDRSSGILIHGGARTFRIDDFSIRPWYLG